MNILFILFFLLTGCVAAHHEVKVFRSKTEITVHTLDLDKGDVIVVDNDKTKVVQP